MTLHHVDLQSELVHKCRLVKPVLLLLAIERRSTEQASEQLQACEASVI